MYKARVITGLFKYTVFRTLISAHTNVASLFYKKKSENLSGEAPNLGFFLESCAEATAMHSDLSP